MTRPLAIALLMLLILPGCTDVDRDLPRAYRRIEVPDAYLTSAGRAEGLRSFTSIARSVMESAATVAASVERD